MFPKSFLGTVPLDMNHERRYHKMMNRFATLAAVCFLTPLATAPLASAEPPPAPPAPPVPVAEPPAGPVPSSPPGILNTPDGWTLTVVGKNESMEPVAPLTTALSSREYLVDGTFTGSVTGGGSTSLKGGVLEAGYYVGCGIVGGPVELTGGIGLTPGITAIGTPQLGGNFGGTILSGQIKIGLRPGTVNIVAVDKKSFKGKEARVTITGFRIKVDGCVGQSFIRSYATLTSSTENTDDVITYMGVTKAV
jgi:MspA